MTAAVPNEDVLAVVCGFLTDVPDILSFALTCSALRPAATTRLLSMRPIQLIAGPSVRQFHSFLFADAPARAPHVHALSINLESKERRGRADITRDTSLLIDILTACPHLGQISLGFSRYLSGDPEEPRIMDALAALPSLRSLSLYGPSERALAPLRNVRAPLCALGLHQCGAGETEFWHPAALEQSLSHLAPTLEKLELYQLIVNPEILHAFGLVSVLPASGSGAPHAQFQFRAVRSLSVALLVGTPLLSVLQHLFPALDGTLSLGQFIIEDDDTDADDEEADADLQEAYAAVRAANLRAQDLDALANADAWTKLDRVVCDALLFSLLGLRCPVRFAMLDFTLGHSVAFSRAARRAMDALRANPVPRLKLTLVLNDGLGVFDALFSPELGGKLTHLTLCLLYVNDSMWRDMSGPRRGADVDAVPLRWDALLGTICASLEPLRKLTYLRLVVHSNAFDDGYAPGSSPAAHAHEFVHALCGPAPSDAAAALARPLPSLRYVFLTTSAYLPSAAGPESKTCGVRERREVSKAWRVAGHGTGAGTGAGAGAASGETQDLDSDGGLALVELRGDVAETIVRNEELVVSALDTMGPKVYDELVSSLRKDFKLLAQKAHYDRTLWAGLVNDTSILPEGVRRAMGLLPPLGIGR